MPRFLEVMTEDRKFVLPADFSDPKAHRMFNVDEDGFAVFTGSDGQKVVVHKSRIVWARVGDPKA